MSFQDYQGILGILAGLIGFAAAVATYFRGVIQQNAKMYALELDLKLMQTRFDVFWTVIEKELPKILIKPHRLDIDKLLRKMQSQEGLTPDERTEMKVKMRNALDEGIGEADSGLALGYALLIARIESESATASTAVVDGKEKKEKEK